MEWLSRASEKLPDGGAYVGTSGFSYHHWSGNFYPKDLPGRQHLPYYASKFPTVEVSSTFNGTPRPEEIAAWDRKTPTGFIISARGPKSVTHDKRLVDCGDEMSEFMAAMRPLKKKLGVVSFQLPEDFVRDTGLLSGFLDSLPEHDRYAMEFRNETWHRDDVYNILADRDVALVTVGYGKMKVHDTQPASWSCARLSGNKPFRDNIYNEDEIAEWSARLKKMPRPLYVYFNNEYRGYAATNAGQMASALGVSWSPDASSYSIDTKWTGPHGPVTKNMNPVSPSPAMYDEKKYWTDSVVNTHGPASREDKWTTYNPEQYFSSGLGRSEK